MMDTRQPIKLRTLSWYVKPAVYSPRRDTLCWVWPVRLDGGRLYGVKIRFLKWILGVFWL